MQFDKYFDHLLPGQYFNTLWVTLPDSTLPYLKKALSPIRPWCEWCIGVDNGNKPNTIPHITLRYLGYDSKEFREKISNTIDEFRNVIRQYTPIELDVGEIFVWQSSPGASIREARINWKIYNHTILKSIHEQLLEIEGFSFFRSLEGDNFTPHITLGKVNLENTASLGEIQEYLQSIPTQKFTFYLENFQINLASKDEKQNVRISLVK